MAKDGWDLPKGDLMKGKKGVVIGVANHDSIAWGIASQLAAQGAEMAFFHLPGMERRVQPLAESAHIDTLDPEFEGLPILRAREDRQIETAMSNSFGFGGTNGCLIMSRA